MLRLLGFLLIFGENPYMACIYYCRLLALLAKLSKSQRKDAKDHSSSWLVLHEHTPPPCWWCDSRREAGMVCPGAQLWVRSCRGEAGSMLSRKACEFCPVCQLWAEKTEIQMCLVFRLASCCPRGLRSRLRWHLCFPVSLHLCILGSQRQSVRDVYCSDIGCNENRFPGLLENSQNLIWLSSSIWSSKAAISVGGIDSIWEAPWLRCWPLTASGSCGCWHLLFLFQGPFSPGCSQKPPKARR